MNSVPLFPEFFRSLCSHNPFPWQRMLAERLVESEWPKALDLPTAADKTACLAITVSVLMEQGHGQSPDQSVYRNQTKIRPLLRSPSARVRRRVTSDVTVRQTARCMLEVQMGESYTGIRPRKKFDELT